MSLGFSSGLHWVLVGFIAALLISGSLGYRGGEVNTWNMINEYPQAFTTHTSLTYNNAVIFFPESYGNDWDAPVRYVDHIYIMDDLVSFESRVVFTSGPAPSVRDDFCTAVVGNKVIFFGGLSDVYMNDIHILDMTTYTWESFYSPSDLIPDGRRFPICFERNGILYVACGRAETHYATDMWTFNLNTYEWNEVQYNTGLAPGLYPPVHAFYNDQLFIYGGFRGYMRTDLWVFNFTSSTWSKDVVSFPFPGEQVSTILSARALVGSELVVISGIVYESTVLADSTVYILDLDKREIVYLKNYEDDIRTYPYGTQYPKPKIFVSATAVGKEIVYSFGQYKCTDDSIWVFDTTTRNFTRKSFDARPMGRSFQALGKRSDSTFLMFGGHNECVDSMYLNDLWEFNLDTRKWTNLFPLTLASPDTYTDFPSGLYQPYMGIFNNTAFIFGGLSEIRIGAPVSFAFDLASRTWTYINLPNAYAFLALVRNPSYGVIGSSLFIIGGFLHDYTSYYYYHTNLMEDSIYAINLEDLSVTEHQLPDSSLLRVGANGFVRNGQFCIQGGTLYESSTILPDINCFDPVSSTFSRAAGSEGNQQGIQFSNMVDVGMGALVGGFNKYGTVTNDIWFFDFYHERWGKQAPAPERPAPMMAGHSIVLKNYLLLAQPYIASTHDSRVLGYDIGKAFCSGTNYIDYNEGQTVLTDQSGDFTYMAYTDCTWVVTGANNFIMTSIHLDPDARITISMPSLCADRTILINEKSSFTGETSIHQYPQGSWINVPAGEFKIRFTTGSKLTNLPGFTFNLFKCEYGFAGSSGVCECTTNHYITIGGQCYPCPSGYTQPEKNKDYCIPTALPTTVDVNSLVQNGDWGLYSASMPTCKYPRSIGDGQNIFIFCLYQDENKDESRYVPVSTYKVTSADTLSWSAVEATGILPPSRQSVCLMQKGNLIFYVGGLAPSANEAHTYTFDTRTYEWKRLSSYALGRYGHSCASDGQNVYIHGGMDNQGNVLSALNVYNYVTDKWSSFASSTSPPLAFHASWISGNNLVLFAGYNGIQELSNIYKYNTGTGIWSSGTSLSNNPCLGCSANPQKCLTVRQNIQAVEYNGEVYIFGGYYKEKNLRDLIVISKDDSTLQYRAVNPTVNILPLNAPPPVQYSTVAVLGSKLVMFGGSTQDGTGYVNWMWGLDMTQRNWISSSSTTEPLARRNSAVTSVPNGYVVFGGYVQLHQEFLSNDLWYFNSVTQQWTMLANYDASPAAPYPRSNAKIVYYKGKLYVFGGNNGGGFSDEHIWTADIANIQSGTQRSIEWVPVSFSSSLKAGQHILEKESFSLVMSGSVAYLWGGYLTVRTGVYEDYTSVYKIDFEAGSLSSIAPTNKGPIARTGLAYGQYMTGFVIYGGRDFKNRNLGDVWYYNTITNAWTRLQSATADGPKLYQAGFSVFGDNFVVYGGISAKGVRVNETWIYQIGTSTWIQLDSTGDDTPLPRLSGHSSMIAGTGMIIYGGSTDYYSSSYGFLYKPSLCNSKNTKTVYGSRAGGLLDDGSGEGEYPGGTHCKYLIKEANSFIIQGNLAAGDKLTITFKSTENGLLKKEDLSGAYISGVFYSADNTLSLELTSSVDINSSHRGQGFNVTYFDCPVLSSIVDGECACPKKYYEDETTNECKKCVQATDAPICSKYIHDSNELSSTVIGGIAGGISAFVVILGVVGGLLYRDQMKKMKAREDQLFVHVKYEDLQFGRLLGAGSFGEVYAGFWRGADVAIKRISAKNITKQSIKAFEDEVAVMVQLRHPNVVLYMAACMEPKRLCIISELMMRGSLHDVLHDETLPIDLAMKMSILTDAAKGLQYLHLSNPPILHRDLKSPNLLLDEKMNVKISDFGLTGSQDKKSTSDEPPGTLLWMAPEVIMGKEYTEKADIYSYAIIMWEVFTRMDPYEGEEIAESVALRVAENGLRPETPPEELIPSEMKALMENCWDADLEKRPNFSAILKQLSATFDEKSSSLSFSMGGSITGSMKSSSDSGRKKVSGPKGQVALVFTDVQSSTALWEKFHEQMATALHIHNEIMRGCIKMAEGYEVRTEGDAFVIAFTSAKNALKFCLRAQEMLITAEWPSTIYSHTATAIESVEQKILFRGLRVRMGVHWCEPMTREDAVTGRMDYFGQSVNKANRIGAFPAGGQIAISEATYEEIQDHFEELGRPLVQDLGEHMLKGMTTADRLFEITPASLAERVEYFKKSGESSAIFQTITSTNDENGQVERQQPQRQEFTWSLDMEKLKVSEVVLGSGSFGTVYRGTYKDSEVAIKKFSKQKIPEKQQFSLLSEISLMMSLDHPNILKLVGANMKAPNICFVLEYAAHGSLQNLIDDKKFSLNDTVRRTILVQVAKSIEYLHTRQPPICHRDLKSANVLIFSLEPMEVKLCDFGLARVRAENQTMTKCGTKAWLAPEVLKGVRYNEKADVYSFSILVWELITRQKPYTNIDPLRLSMEVAKGMRPSVPRSGDPKLIDLMKRCWDDNPDARPSFTKILSELM